MKNPWIINFIFAIIGFLLVVFISIQSNTIATTLLRGFYSFLTFFVLGFALKWAIMFVFKDPTNNDTLAQSGDENDKEGNAQNINTSDTSTKTNSSTSTAIPTGSETDPFANIGESFEGDIYEKSSQYIRELLNEDNDSKS